MINVAVSIILGITALFSAVMAIEEKRPPRSLLYFVVFSISLAGFMIHVQLLALALMALALSLGSFAFIATLYSLAREEKREKKSLGLIVASIFALTLLAVFSRVELRGEVPEMILGLHKSALPLILAHGVFILALALSLRVIIKEGEKK